jgi:hypothetical protein
MNTKINDDLINHLSEIVYKYILSCIFVIVSAAFLNYPLEPIFIGVCIAYLVESVVIIDEIWRRKQ